MGGITFVIALVMLAVDDFVGGIIFVIALVMLAVDYFVANKFEEIAIMKGHNDKSYFWCSFLLGPIGFAMVIALPDRQKTAFSAPIFDNNEFPEI